MFSGELQPARVPSISFLSFREFRATAENIPLARHWAMYRLGSLLSGPPIMTEVRPHLTEAHEQSRAVWMARKDEVELWVSEAATNAYLYGSGKDLHAKFGIGLGRVLQTGDLLVYVQDRNPEIRSSQAADLLEGENGTGKLIMLATVDTAGYEVRGMSGNIATHKVVWGEFGPRTGGGGSVSLPMPVYPRTMN